MSCFSCKREEPTPYSSGFTGARYCETCGFRITTQLTKDKLRALQYTAGAPEADFRAIAPQGGER